MVAAIPTQAGYCQLLDLGANVDCSAENLYQFAVMGSVAAQALGVHRPRVALLNIGTEDIKGNQQVKLAATLLQNARGLNYVATSKVMACIAGRRMWWCATGSSATSCSSPAKGWRP